MNKQPSFKIKLLAEKKDFAKFLIAPLDQGYGHTLGNALRRCLLTSMAGAAITKVKIDGVKHQFTTLPGMKEDIAELILNIKQVRLTSQGDKEVKLTLDVKGPKEVKAGDIKTPAGVKIVSKDLKLAKLADKKARLKMELWVEKGYGYSPAEERKSSTLGVISIDAIFRPIMRVNYKVEAIRVGRITDLDSLVLNVWTDGTVKPKAAVEKAAEILVGFFKQVYNPVVSKKEKKEEVKEDNEDLKLTVEEISLPTRIANALRKGGYPTVKSLIEAEAESLSKVKNLGGKSVTIITDKLKKRGLSLK